MKSYGGSFDLEVLVHGKSITEYTRRFETFVEGRIGSEYTLRVRNNTNEKALAVVSVDGLSVMNGQTASHDSGGYVIHPFSHVDIPGWRLNNNEAAHFYFGTLPEAYASQMGKPQNIGVIGAAFFFERKQEPVPYSEYQPKGGHYPDDAGLESMSYGATRGVGTGFGRRTEHRVTSVEFDRDSTAAAILTVRYDTAENLRARGINVTHPHYRPDPVIAPNPFPAEPGCKPPTNWRG